MKLVRPVLALAVGASLVVAGAAGAASKPKPVCNLVKDAAGDADQGLLTVSNEASWDVRTADVATNKKSLTTVIRVAKLSKSTSAAPEGSQWRFDFLVGKVNLYTQATSTPFGDRFVAGWTDTTSHGFADSGATGVFDTVKNEVRITVPLSTFSPQATIKPGTHLSSLEAAAGDYVNVAGGPPSASVQADGATGTKDYIAGAASCVVVGR